MEIVRDVRSLWAGRARAFFLVIISLSSFGVSLVVETPPESERFAHLKAPSKLPKKKPKPKPKKVKKKKKKKKPKPKRRRR